MAILVSLEVEMIGQAHQILLQEVQLALPSMVQVLPRLAPDLLIPMLMAIQALPIRVGLYLQEVVGMASGEMENTCPVLSMPGSNANFLGCRMIHQNNRRASILKSTTTFLSRLPDTTFPNRSIDSPILLWMIICWPTLSLLATKFPRPSKSTRFPLSWVDET